MDTSSDGMHEQKMSRECKSLYNTRIESKIIGEWVAADEKVRKSRRDAFEASINSPAGERNERSRASSNNSSSSDVSGNIDSKRSMRSQNADFVLKQKNIMKKLTGRVSPSPNDDVNAKTEVKSDVRPVVIVDKQGRNIDPYCWNCHQVGSQMLCSLCPRSFHSRCLSSKLADLSPGSGWACPECVNSMNADNTDKRSPAMQRLTVEKLTTLLKFALNRMESVPESKPFCDVVSLEDFPEYNQYVVHPMNLKILRENVSSSKYGSTGSFVADARWILHNSIIFNTSRAKLTSIAKSIMKVCRNEMNEIETCPECYEGANTRMDWFIQVCSKPHILLWAKLKGFPYWPAKAMAVSNTGMVDVRFFGAHDKAWLRPKDCYLYSQKDPNSNNKLRRNEIEQALAELNQHVEKLKMKYGLFKPATCKAPYSPHSDNEILKAMLPCYVPQSGTKNVPMIIAQSPDEKTKKPVESPKREAVTLVNMKKNLGEMQPKVILAKVTTAFSKKLNRTIMTEGYELLEEKNESLPLTNSQKDMDLSDRELELGEVVTTYQRTKPKPHPRSTSTNRNDKSDDIEEVAPVTKRMARSKSICIVGNDIRDDLESENELHPMAVDGDDADSKFGGSPRKRKRTSSNTESTDVTKKVKDCEGNDGSKLRTRGKSVDTRLMMCYREAVAKKLSNIRKNSIEEVKTSDEALPIDKAVDLNEPGVTTVPFKCSTPLVLNIRTSALAKTSTEVSTTKKISKVPTIKSISNLDSNNSSRALQTEKYGSPIVIDNETVKEISLRVSDSSESIISSEKSLSKDSSSINDESVLDSPIAQVQYKESNPGVSEDSLPADPKTNVPVLTTETIRTPANCMGISLTKDKNNKKTITKNYSVPVSGTNEIVSATTNEFSVVNMVDKPEVSSESCSSFRKSNETTKTCVISDTEQGIRKERSFSIISSEARLINCPVVSDSNTQAKDVSLNKNLNESGKGNNSNDNIMDILEIKTEVEELDKTDGTEEKNVDVMVAIPSSIKPISVNNDSVTSNVTNSIINGNTNAIHGTTIKRITNIKNKSPTENISTPSNVNSNNTSNDNNSSSFDVSLNSSGNSQLPSVRTDTNKAQGTVILMKQVLNNENNKRKAVSPSLKIKRAKGDNETDGTVKTIPNKIQTNNVIKIVNSGQTIGQVLSVQGKNMFRIVTGDIVPSIGQNNKTVNNNSNSEINTNKTQSPRNSSDLSLTNNMVYIPTDSLVQQKTSSNVTASLTPVITVSESISSNSPAVHTVTIPQPLILNNGTSNIVLRPVQSLTSVNTLRDSPTKTNSSNPVTTGTLRVVPQAFLLNPTATCASVPHSNPPPENQTPDSSSLPGSKTIPPSCAGLISKILNESAYKMAEYFRYLLEECIGSMGSQSGVDKAQLFHKIAQYEKLKWQHSAKIKELKHNTELQIKEIRACLEAEKARAIQEVKMQAEIEKILAVEEAKKKQWCVVCLREAQLYCCRNVSYCESTCQQAHWPIHSENCEQYRAEDESRTQVTPVVNSNRSLSSGSIGFVRGNVTNIIASNSNGSSGAGSNANKKQVIIKAVSSMSSLPNTYKNVNIVSTTSPGFKLTTASGNAALSLVINNNTTASAQNSACDSPKNNNANTNCVESTLSQHNS